MEIIFIFKSQIFKYPENQLHSHLNSELCYQPFSRELWIQDWNSSNFNAWITIKGQAKSKLKVLFHRSSFRVENPQSLIYTSWPLVLLSSVTQRLITSHRYVSIQASRATFVPECLWTQPEGCWACVPLGWPLGFPLTCMPPSRPFILLDSRPPSGSRVS